MAERKIILTEEQARLIREWIQENPYSILPTHISEGIQAGKTSLGDNPAIPKEDTRFLMKIVHDYYADVLNEFSDDIASVDYRKVKNKLSRYLTKAKKLEQPIREKLEKICSDTVRTLFETPEKGIDLECRLSDTIDKTFHIYPDTDEDYEYEDVDSIGSRSSEVAKRRIIDMLTIGAAMDLSERARERYLHVLFSLDEELPHIYSKMVKMNNFLLFNEPDISVDDNDHKQGACSCTTVSQNGEINKIEVNGIAFPYLLTETIKGFLELSTSNGLPDTLGEAMDVINQADALQFEPWDMILGPALWYHINDLAGGFSTASIPCILYELSTVETKDFFRTMREMFRSTRRGKEMLEKLSKYARENSAEPKLKKIDDKLIISDGTER